MFNKIVTLFPAKIKEVFLLYQYPEGEFKLQSALFRSFLKTFNIQSLKKTRQSKLCSLSKEYSGNFIFIYIYKWDGVVSPGGVRHGALKHTILL